MGCVIVKEGDMLVAVFIVLVVWIGWIIMFHYLPFIKKMKTAPPGCMGWPVIGETLAFLKPHHSCTRGTYLDEHCNRYGKVFRTHLFGSPTIVSCDPDLNAFVLQNENRLFQCSYPKNIRGVLGNSTLLVVVGDVHKRLRAQALNVINSVKSKDDFLQSIDDNAVHVMNSWQDRQTVLFCEEARKFTFYVIVKQILSLTPNDPLTSIIMNDFLTFMKGLVSLPLCIPGTPYAKAVQARKRILSAVETIVEERSAQSGEYKPSGDILDMLLESSTVTYHEKLSLVLDVLLGGFETTYLVLTIIIHLLAQSPLALQELKEEHEMIAGTKPKSSPLSWDHYKKMTFTHYVINEALRHGNIVKFVHRKALKDVKFKEFEIPAGWKVLPVLSWVHLEESCYENALEFNPWRWKNSQCGTSLKQFMPFGGGSRLCPGSDIAKVEISFFLHHLVLNYRWKLDEPDNAMAYPYVEFSKRLPIAIKPISHVQTGH